MTAATLERATPEDFDWEVFAPVFTINVGRGVSQVKAKANITKTFAQGWMVAPKSLGGGKVAGFLDYQEIDEADLAAEHDILTGIRKGQVTAHAEHQMMLGKAVYRYAGFNQATPVSVPKPWVIEDVVVSLTSHGLAKVSPHRVCVQAICSHPAMSGHRVAFLNGHYPLARLGGGAGEALWNECHDSWQRITHGYMVRGIPVVATRDTNHHGRMPKLVPVEKQLLPTGIDRISVSVPDNSEVQIKKIGSPKTIDLNIDGHDGKGVGLKFWVPQAA